MIGVEGAQGRQGDGEGAWGVVAFVAQEEEEGAHLLFLQGGWVGAGVPSDEHGVTDVGLAGARAQIAQLDKLPETIYGLVVW